MIVEKAYAKINLVLNVTGKREDGFHEVDFLMDSVELHDKVIIERSEEDEVICKRAPFIKKEKNLAYLAYKLMKKKFNLPDNLKITVHKVIPVSAGMAGGSSDAAAVIRGLNRMYKLALTYEEMANIGAELGSDIPFCIYSSLCRAQGRGEKITKLDNKLPSTNIVIINPGVGLSTPQVYKKHVIEDTNRNIEDVLNAKSYEEFTRLLSNDLEKTAMKIEPRIEQMKNYIRKKYSNNRIMVSGSGPTILVFSNDENETMEIYNYAKTKYHNTYYTKTRG